MPTPPISPVLLASGNLQLQVLGRLFVVTDDLGKFLAVGVYSHGRRHQRIQTVMSAVGDRVPTMTLRARWTGPLPKAGDYLMSPYRPRSAYRVISVPLEHNGARVQLKVERVGLPVPDDAVVHPWRWDPRGKNKGVIR